MNKHKITKRECSVEVAGPGYKVGNLTIAEGSRVYYTVSNGCKIIHFVERK